RAEMQVGRATPAMCDLLKPGFCLFEFLPDASWPEDPLVPPFIVISDRIFSPIPIEGLRAPQTAGESVPLFAPVAFLAEGGWQALRPALTAIAAGTGRELAMNRSAPTATEAN